MTVEKTKASFYQGFIKKEDRKTILDQLMDFFHIYIKNLSLKSFVNMLTCVFYNCIYTQYCFFIPFVGTSSMTPLAMHVN